MNLILDFGNTLVKAALYDGNHLESVHSFESPEDLQLSLSLFASATHCIIGSVTAKHQSLISTLSQHYKTMVFKADTPVPLTNKYKSALTLGSDRLATAVGSFTHYPNQPTLTIDAGTCIKYNFVNHKNEYIGGAISPGIPMRLRAMHEFTHALPKINTDKNYDKLTGQTSAESLLSGALLGAACEVDGMIDRYHKQFKDLIVVLTGGDGDYLARQIKNRFFAHPTILLEGLNTILEFNLEK